jgi:hypothetical protein
MAQNPYTLLVEAHPQVIHHLVHVVDELGKGHRVQRNLRIVRLPGAALVPIRHHCGDGSGQKHWPGKFPLNPHNHALALSTPRTLPGVARTDARDCPLRLLRIEHIVANQLPVPDELFQIGLVVHGPRYGQFGRFVIGAVQVFQVKVLIRNALGIDPDQIDDAQVVDLVPGQDVFDYAVEDRPPRFSGSPWAP